MFEAARDSPGQRQAGPLWSQLHRDSQQEPLPRPLVRFSEPTGHTPGTWADVGCVNFSLQAKCGWGHPIPLPRPLTGQVPLPSRWPPGRSYYLSRCRWESSSPSCLTPLFHRLSFRSSYIFT